ncbi:hypothetical protein M0805_009203 [Coniferiporia weirii]|nr:hypothetical protein M0805_009203 [Coniferiporia weirii]
MPTPSSSKRPNPLTDTGPVTLPNGEFKKKFVSTPVDRKAAGSHPFTTRDYKANDLQKLLYTETKPFVLGPMPISDFLESFLPRNSSAPPRGHVSRLHFFPVVTDQFQEVVTDETPKHKEENKMYGPFIECMKKLNLASLEFVDTSNRPDLRWSKSGIKPDVSAYRKGSEILAASFSEMELFIEFKVNTSYDPFEDIPPSSTKARRRKGFVKRSENSQVVLGQMASYAIAQLGSSFRTHVFSVLIFGCKARFIRWDRAGAIVSEPVDYIEKPEILVDFFDLFDQLTPEQRGHDTTASDPSDEERKKATQAFTQRHLGESEINYKLRCDDFRNQHLYKFSVPSHSSTGLSKSYYIGTLSKHKVRSLVGRSSRGCPVYDLERDRICYMKDTWRIQSPRLLREGEIYKILEKNKVPYIAPLVNEGDVGDIRMSSVMQDHASFTNASASGERSDSAPALPGDVPSETDSAVDARSSEPLEDHAGTVFGSGKVSLSVHPEPDASNSGSNGSDRTGTATSDGNGAPPSSGNSSIPTSHVPPSREVLDNTHVTLTQLFVDSPWVHRSKDARGLHGYIHYRLVLGVVGRDLTSFKSSREMLTAIMDAIEAHGKAYEAGILHRDISIGNIMITHDGRGMLIDWDLAKPVDEDGGIRYGRTGTWQFISAALLQNPRTKQHIYTDDLESFLHVVTYTSMLYTQTNYSTERLDDLTEYMQMYDEDAIRQGTEFSYAVGGKKKLLMLRSGSYIPEDLEFLDRPLLYELLAYVSLMFKPIYETKPIKWRMFSDPENVNRSGEDPVTKAERHEAQKNAEIVFLNKWSEGTGTKIHGAFRQVLGEKSAWPTDDTSRRAPVSSPYHVSQMYDFATSKKRSAKSDKEYPKLPVSYPVERILHASPRTTGTDEGVGLDTIHEEDEGPPRKRKKIRTVAKSSPARLN